MRGTIQHIATLLIGIFLFPIVFQSLHYGWHAHHASHSHSIDEEVFPINEQTIKTLDVHHSKVEKEDCHVCNYKFAPNNLTSIAQIAAMNSKIAAPYLGEENNRAFQTFLSNRPSRAPPVC